MPSEKMTALAMSGPIERLDEAISRFVMGRDFHPEEAIPFLAGMRRLKPVEIEDPWEERLPRADKLLAEFDLKPEYVPFEEYDLESTDSFMDSFAVELNALDEEEQAIQARAHGEMDPLLYALEKVPVSLRDVDRLRYVQARVGRMPEEKWPEFLATTDSRNDEFAMETRREEGYVYLLALALPDATDRLDGNLVRFEFERFRPSRGDQPDVTAAAVIAHVDEEMQADQARLAEIAARREVLREEDGQELLRRRAWLKFRSACAQYRAYAGRSHGRFYLAGWIPARDEESFVAEFEAEPGFSCVASAPNEVKNAKPPVRIREGGIRSVLTPLVKMYGMPAYGSVDPRVFMFFSYTLFFGIMFGDTGQGLCLALLGFLLYKKTGTWLWRIVGFCGISAMVFGLVYGSVFGLEHLLPWGGIHPLEGENIMPVLLAGAAVGIVIIVICMAINIVNALRMRDMRLAFFSANGVSGLVLYVAVIAAIVCAFTKAANLLQIWFVGPFILLPILLIWFGEPLGKLLEGKRNWKPESWGMFVVEGFFEIFETAISYMSNTMSFLRLGAFAISHAGMMMVVSMLAGSGGSPKNVIVMILGNAFVAGLEAALCSIQIIRLQFYEIFGRFYVSGGQEFAPAAVDYTT